MTIDSYRHAEPVRLVSGGRNPAEAPPGYRHFASIEEAGGQRRIRLLAGPYDTNDAALTALVVARQRLEGERPGDPELPWVAWGTSALAPEKSYPKPMYGVI